ELSEDRRIMKLIYTVAEGDMDLDGVPVGGVISIGIVNIAFVDSTMEDAPLIDYVSPGFVDIVVVGVRPTLTDLSIAFSNHNPTVARVGDTVIVRLTATEVIASPEVTIAGRKAKVTVIDDGVDWKAEYVLTEDDSEGAIDFVIGGLEDLVGNTAEPVTAV